ncbi:MAG: phosphatidate cytidylyltransferase [Phycisphaerales bacterium]
MLRQRLLLGPVLIALVIAGFWLDGLAEGVRLGDHALPPATVLGPGILLMLGFASWELTRMLRDNGVQASVRLGVAATVLGYLATMASGTGGPWVATSAVVTMLAALVFFTRGRSFEGIVAATGGVLLSFTYLGVLGGFWILLRQEHAAWVGLWVLLVTKSCDIGAYFTGRRFGRTKLAPWLSPGKTREGLLGGTLTAGMVALGGLWLLRGVGADPPISLVGAFFVGTAIGVVGQAGDLIASLFKRDSGRKDSSGSLPGFGGWLDVLDSPLLVGVVAFWSLRLLG